MRKLATIQRISAIRPITGADKIVAADVLGWTVVVGKDEFKEGDLAVYFEIDSWCDSSIPAFQTEVFRPRYTKWGDKVGMRLKTIKLRKQISQGLLMPLSAFPALAPEVFGTAFIEGEDVTELLKIEKWEPAEEASSNAGGPNKTAGAGKFPSFIRKTDQERVQNYINELPKHDNETFEVSIKLDGSSMTVYRVGKKSPHYEHIRKDVTERKLRKLSKLKRIVYCVKRFLRIEKDEDFVGVCSRNIELSLDDSNHFSQYVRDNDIIGRLKGYGATRDTEHGCGGNIAIQGELLAPSIQQNYEKVEGFEFYVYDVFNIDSQKYYGPAQARAITEALGLKYVPVLEENMSLRDFDHEAYGAITPAENMRAAVENILAYAEGPGMNPGVKREGIVFKANGSEFSFKAISNSYLLHKEGSK